MPSIFVSYRRQETAVWVGRLASDLRDQFGKSSVFQDIDSIAYGRDFFRIVDESIAKSDVILVVIGRDFLTTEDAHGKRRIDNAEDPVRYEIERAMAQKRPILPLLVDDAKMPPKEELPAPIAPLARLNARHLSNDYWDTDVLAVVQSIGELTRDVPTRPEIAGEAFELVPELSRRNLIRATIAVVATGAAVTLYRHTPSESPPSLDAPLRIAVMQIRSLREGEVPGPVCDLMYLGLNEVLDKFKALTVFSKEAIEWKKDKHQEATNRRPSDFELAQELGVTRMISGDMWRANGKITLQLRVVDVAGGGGQRGSVEATASENGLVGIQNDVGIKLLHVLEVPISSLELEWVQARPEVDGAVFNRWAKDATGIEEEAPATPPRPPASGSARPGPPHAWGFSWPATAHAQDPTDEAAVIRTLERYRVALQSKKPDELEKVYVELPDKTRQALERYFNSVGSLEIKFSDYVVLFDGGEALATFTRVDKFTDLETRQEATLSVRVSAVLERQQKDAWKIKALRKPS